MNWVVDTPARVDGVACVPIVETRVTVSHRGRFIAGHGEKRPVMILVFRGDGVSGFDLGGRMYEAEEIEQRYPQAVSKAAALLAQVTD